MLGNYNVKSSECFILKHKIANRMALLRKTVSELLVISSVIPGYSCSTLVAADAVRKPLFSKSGELSRFKREVIVVGSKGHPSFRTVSMGLGE